MSEDPTELQGFYDETVAPLVAYDEQYETELAGDGPCWIRMLGARRPDATIHYPATENAAKHGASVSEPTNDARRAYADWPSEFEETKLPWPPG
jgi:hypothetical protein